MNANYSIKTTFFNDPFAFVCPFDRPSVRRHFSEANPNAIDQTWYKRAVDQYAVEPDSFVYSVPFGTGTGMWRVHQ